MAPTLVYWNIRGLTVPIRLLLAYADAPYEYKEYDLLNRAEWYEKDKSKMAEVFDFPNLPYLIDGDVKLTQSRAILLYLAQQHNLDGETPAERVRITVILDQISDIRRSFYEIVYPPEGIQNPTEVQKGLLKEFQENLPVQVARLSKFLGTNKWVVGSRLTYADFVLYDLLATLNSYLKNSNISTHPNLVSYMSRVEALPRVGDCMKTKIDKLPNDHPKYERYSFIWKNQ